MLWLKQGVAGAVWRGGFRISFCGSLVGSLDRKMLILVIHSPGSTGFIHRTGSLHVKGTSEVTCPVCLEEWKCRYLTRHFSSDREGLAHSCNLSSMVLQTTGRQGAMHHDQGRHEERVTCESQRMQTECQTSQCGPEFKQYHLTGTYLPKDNWQDSIRRPRGESVIMIFC